MKKVLLIAAFLLIFINCAKKDISPLSPNEETSEGEAGSLLYNVRGQIVSNPDSLGVEPSDTLSWIYVYFSSAIDTMSAEIYVRRVKDGIDVEYEMNWDIHEDSSSLIMKPASRLNYNESYVFVIDAGQTEDFNGNMLDGDGDGRGGEIPEDNYTTVFTTYRGEDKFNDIDGDGILDGLQWNGKYTSDSSKIMKGNVGEPFEDERPYNYRWDPGEKFSDLNENNRYDGGERYTDVNKDGKWSENERYSDEINNGKFDSEREHITLDRDGDGRYDKGGKGRMISLKRDDIKPCILPGRFNYLLNGERVGEPRINVSIGLYIIDTTYAIDGSKKVTGIDETTIDSSTVVLYDKNSEERVKIDVSYDNFSASETFGRVLIDPRSNLRGGTSYVIKVSPELSDVYGNRLYPESEGYRSIKEFTTLEYRSVNETGE